MPTNQKIKSITLIKDLPDLKAPIKLKEDFEIGRNFSLGGLLINRSFAGEIYEHSPEFFKIEYEKPKSNVKYATYKPNVGTIYCYVDSNGLVEQTSWDDDRTDNLRFGLNNVFIGDERKSNAQKQADRNQLLADIERFAVENNDVIDWSGANGVYRLIFSHQGKEWTFKYSPTWQSITTYFSSETIANKALEKFKDRLDILLD